MKWFDENAYSKTNGSGIIPLFDQERSQLRPGDEILVPGGEGWEPAIVASNVAGLITTQYGPATGKMGRTKRLPRGFLCSSKKSWSLQLYSEELLAYARQDNRPDFPSDDLRSTPTFVQHLATFWEGVLLKEEYPGIDVPLMPLKHRLINDLFDFLALAHFQLHDTGSGDSTRHGMWVKYFEFAHGDLKHLHKFLKLLRRPEELLKPLRPPGEPLVTWVDGVSIRWIGSEERYREFRAVFRPVFEPYPELLAFFESTESLKEEQPAVATAVAVPAAEPPMIMKEQLDALVESNRELKQRSEKLEVEIEQMKKAFAEQEERIKREYASKVSAVSAAASIPPPPPPDRTPEFLAEINKIFHDNVDRNFTCKVIMGRVASWETETASLKDSLRLDKHGKPRDFREIVKAALDELWETYEIQRAVFEHPHPDAKRPFAKQQTRHTDLRYVYCALEEPLYSVPPEIREKRQNSEKKS